MSRFKSSSRGVARRAVCQLFRFFFFLLGVYHERCVLTSPAAYPLIARVVRRNDDDDDGDDEVVRGSGSRQQFFYFVFLDNDEKINMLSRRGPLFYCVHVFFVCIILVCEQKRSLTGRGTEWEPGLRAIKCAAILSCRRRAVRVRACVSAPLLFGQVSIVSPSHNAIVTEEEEGTCF